MIFPKNSTTSDTTISIPQTDPESIEEMRHSKIKDFCSYVIMAFIFFIPISTSAANVLAILIVLLWVADGNFKEKFTEIKHNKVALAILAYVALHLVGLLWTEDMAFGLYTIKKQWKLLLMPIFLGMVKKEHTKYYIGAFIWAMILSVTLSYCLWLGLIGGGETSVIQGNLFTGIGTYIDEYGKATPYSSPTPFNSHIVYNPFLALAIYLLLISTKQKSKVVCYYSVLLLMTANMFLTHGRTGQVTFVVLIVIFIFQNIPRTEQRLLIIGIGITTFLVAYFMAPPFQQRINRTINNARNINEHSENSITERLVYMSVCANIVKSNPFIGLGTGDFPSEYKKKVQQMYPNSPFSKKQLYFSANPHNQYLLTTTQFGIIGLLILLSIFYQQIRFALNSYDFFLKQIRLTVPIFFLVIFLGDSYLQTSSTTLLFSIFSGVNQK